MQPPGRAPPERSGNTTRRPFDHLFAGIGRFGPKPNPAEWDYGRLSISLAIEPWRCLWENQTLFFGEIAVARQIQSQPVRAQAGIGAFLGLLANAAFWAVIAIVVPVRPLVEALPEIAPFARWAPLLFYALAFWSLIRAVRILQGLAARRTAPLARAMAPGAAQAGRQPQARKPRTNMGLPVNRIPTVRRMR